MDYGTSQLDELHDLLSRGKATAFVRAVAQLEASRWTLRYFDAVVGPRPSHWQPKEWRYEGLVFLEAAVASEVLRAALSDSSEQGILLHHYGLTVPALSGQLNWRHEPSRAQRYGEPAFPWPVWRYEFHARERFEWRAPTGILIGDGCPSFPEFALAFWAFFYGEPSSSPQGQVPSGFGVVRMAQCEARMRRVRITPTHLAAQVDGDDIAGTRIELTGTAFHLTRRVGRTGRVRLPLRRALPDDAWLYLSRDTRWLDYRALGARFVAPGALAREGVEVEVPDDPASEIDGLIAGGEGPRVEFKSNLPKSREQERRVFKTVAAFASADGGTVVFGVDPDETTVLGLPDVDVPRERDRLADLTRSIVAPTPKFEVRAYDRDGKILLVLRVEPGDDAPYGITVPANKPIEYYVRRGATTFPARHDEIRNLARRAP